MKYGITLVIVAGLMVGISSGGFLSDPAEANEPSWTSFGIFDNYEPFSLADWIDYDYAPFNLSEWLNPDSVPVVPDDPPSFWEPVPLVMPQPLPLSKEDLFGSLTTISPTKQSLLSSQKNSYNFKNF